MAQGVPQPSSPRSGRRVLAALLVAAVGCLIVWIATPYNNFVLRGQFIADSYLPIIGLVLMIGLVLIVNPLLRRFAPRFSFRAWQLALIFGILLVACVVPSSGLHRTLPYSIAQTAINVKENDKLAEGFRKMDLPPSLFADPIGYKRDVPASEHFIGELPKGASIPWRNWLGPALSWGSFVVFSWLMMIGLGLIVLPQWRKNERLPFPLLTLERSLIETPDDGHAFAPLFRSRGFWIAAGAVFLIHFLAGLKIYYPDSVPAAPLSWNLSNVFTDTPLRHLPGHLRSARLYFAFIGITFFMPNRIGFSIWFFELAYGAYIVIGNEYAPPFEYNTIYDHRMGAMFTVTAFIIWLGRKHWLHVFRCIFRARDAEERRDRNAGVLFSAGCVGMYFWLLWVGVQPLWAAFYVGIGFMVSLLITRIVAETGMPFIRIDFRYTIGVVKLAPDAWLGAVSLYFATVWTVFFTLATRVSAATMTTHAVGLDEDAEPKHQSRLAFLFIGVLLAGFFIAGAAHLTANYHHSMSLDGQEQPLSGWGTTRFDIGNADLIALQDGRVDRPVYNQPAHLAFGAGLGAFLEWACLTMPRWPFHPIGLIMTASFYANEAWASVLLGWFIKVLLVRFGGARLYRTVRPVFFGLIMGEVFAAVFWSIEPVVRICLDLPYKIVEVLPK